MIRKNIVTDCTKCRKKIHEEEQELFLKESYKFYANSVDSAVCYVVSAVLWSMIIKGRTKKYINQLYDSMIMIFTQNKLLGKEVRLTDVMKKLEEEYDIDFDRIRITVETEKQFKEGIEIK